MHAEPISTTEQQIRQIIRQQDLDELLHHLDGEPFGSDGIRVRRMVEEEIGERIAVGMGVS